MPYTSKGNGHGRDLKPLGACLEGNVLSEGNLVVREGLGAGGFGNIDRCEGGRIGEHRKKSDHRWEKRIFIFSGGRQGGGFNVLLQKSGGCSGREKTTEGLL